EDKLLRDFVSLETFRKELLQVLADHHLPTALCDDEANWLMFLEAYAGVIEDGSLTCKNGSDKLKVVDKVTFTKGPPTKDGHVFGIKWNILAKNGEQYEVEVVTRRSGEGLTLLLSGF